MVTTALGVPPVSLAFERVMCPFLMCEVNRYAGVAYDSLDAVAMPRGGQLIVKGLESERRCEQVYLCDHTHAIVLMCVRLLCR